MDRLFIKSEDLKILTDIFASYCPNAEIWAYGSRVNGRAHEGSDIDLVVKDFRSDSADINELKDILRESSIPFLTDIQEFDKLPETFQQEILKNYIIIYPIN